MFLLKLVDQKVCVYLQTMLKLWTVYKKELNYQEEQVYRLWEIC